MVVESIGEFTSSTASFVAGPSATPASSEIVGQLLVSANGVGSQTDAVVSAPTLMIGGPITVSAKGVGAATTLLVQHLSENSNHVLVEADSLQAARFGAFARLSLDEVTSTDEQSTLGELGTVQVSAVQLFDRAALRISSLRFGGHVQLGILGNQGTAYLELGGEQLSSVSIHEELQRSVIGLTMPDKDLSNPEAFARMMSINGFRLAHDELLFKDSLGGYLTVIDGSGMIGGSTADERINSFLGWAGGISSEFPAGMIAKAVIDNSLFIAYDFDGEGITGLIKLEDYRSSDFRIGGELIPDGAGTDLSTVAVINIHSDSEQIEFGNISRDLSNLQTRGVAESIVVSLSTNNGEVLVPRLNTNAAGYRGEIDIKLRADGDGRGVIFDDNIEVESSALASHTNIEIDSGSSGSIKAGNVVVAASGARATADMALTTGRDIQTGSVTLDSSGAHASVRVHMESTALSLSSPVPNFLFNDNWKISSSGFAAISELSFRFFSGGGLTLKGGINVEASADEASASMTGEIRTIGTSIQGGISALAEGTGANAVLRVHQLRSEYADLVRLDMSVGSGLVTEALGAHSTSIAEIALDHSLYVARPGLTLARASGDYSKSTLTLTSENGGISLPSLQVHASGFQSDATATIRGNATNWEILLQEGLVRAEGKGARSNAQLSAKEIQASSLVIEGVAEGAAAGLGIEAKAMNVVDGLSVRAHSAFSSAIAQLRSSDGVTKFGGSLEVHSTGHGSVTSLGLTGSAVNALSGVDVAKNLSVIASNTSAQAVANLSSSLSKLRIGGNVNLRAMAEQASAITTMVAGATGIALQGDVTALSSGDLSTATLTVNTQPLPGVPTSPNAAGQIEINGTLALAATGVSAISAVSLIANPVNGIRIGKDVDLLASGAGALTRLTLTSADQFDVADGNEVIVNNAVRVVASSSASKAEATFISPHGNVSLGSLELSAGGSESQSTFVGSAAGSLTFSSGGIQLAASGDNSSASVLLSSTAGMATVNGSVVAIASGEASAMDVSLTSGGGLSITKDVDAMALAEGSELSLALTHGGAAGAVSVAGQIRLLSDSGNTSTVSATTDAVFALGKFGNAGIDLSMSAVQSVDHVNASLSLMTQGGVVQIGGTGQRGTAELTLTGHSAATGNKLVDVIDIDFSGKAGRAAIQFDVDQDNLTASALPVVKLFGFRLDADSLYFGTVSGLEFETGITSLNAFTSAALDHFNTGAQGTPVSAVFAAGSSTLNKTFVAYDIDGSGISAIIELDGVKLNDFVNHYQTSNGLG